MQRPQVSKESEIRTLSPLRSLRSLCLTGNPIDARRKGLRVICMGILPGLMSLDGVKISRVASVRRVPANRYASPGKGKASSPSDHNSPAPDMILNPLFSLKPADEGLQVNASQARERQCSLSVVGQATVQHLEALLQDAAQAHGLQVRLPMQKAHGHPYPHHNSCCLTAGT